MSEIPMPRYRIFASEDERSNLPATVVVEERYPAFIVVAASTADIDELRKQYPIEEMPISKPPLAAVATADDWDAQEYKAPYSLVIRFSLPIRQAWIDEIKDVGCDYYAAIGTSTIVVNCPNKQLQRTIQSLPYVEQLKYYQVRLQIVSNFFAQDVSNIAPTETSIQFTLSNQSVVAGVIVVTFFNQTTKELAIRRLKKNGIRQITDVNAHSLIIDLRNHDEPRQALAIIKARQGVRSIEEKTINVVYNNIAREVIGRGVVSGNVPTLGLTGKGEIVAVADTGLDTGDISTLHADFRDRVLDIHNFPFAESLKNQLKNPNDDGAADIYSGHGTHVAGSIIGSGVQAAALQLQDQVQGMAPEAQLIFQAVEKAATWNSEGGDVITTHGLYGIPDDLYMLFQAAYVQGARIHSNSWGATGADAWGIYNQFSTDVDEFVWQHRDFLIVIAAGNEANDTNPIGKPGSVTPPGTAKNCLTVGACKNAREGASVEQIAIFSGRGPCNVGRHKPDVVAPGTEILSVASSKKTIWSPDQKFDSAPSDYFFNSGTSMATPLVAGSAALIRQYLRERRGIDAPSAALMKAIIIHSCLYHSELSATNAWFDNTQGWGRIDLQQVLSPPAQRQVLFFDMARELQTGDERRFRIQVGDTSVPLKMTLVYTDSAGEALKNNLNLFAWSPSRRYLIGNDATGSGVIDRTNNVEGIVVNSPEIGEWTIRVVASNIPEGPQDFALVISGGGANHRT